MRERFPTTILRICIILFAIVGILVCVFALPSCRNVHCENLPWIRLLAVFDTYRTIYGCCLLLFRVVSIIWLLMNGIDRDSTLSPKNLKAI
jgi:hypothetical protein